MVRSPLMAAAGQATTAKLQIIESGLFLTTEIIEITERTGHARRDKRKIERPSENKSPKLRSDPRGFMVRDELSE